MKEIEVKFQLENREIVKDKIQKLGATYEGEYSQTDIWFDTEDLSLRRANNGIRLRRENGETLLTLKHRLVEDGKFRESEEIEVAVGDFEKVCRILGILGFREVIVLKKQRLMWKYGELMLSLDRVENLGDFLELEGPKDQIEKIIEGLGFQNLQRITKHYGQILGQGGWDKDL